MNEQEIDLRELWQIVRTNQKTIAKITGVFLGVAVAYLIIVPNTYQSTALLRIKQERGLASSIMEQLPMGNAQLTKQQMNTNAEILKSRHVVIPVIEQTEEEKDGKYPRYEDYVKDHIVTKPYKDTEILEVDVTGKTPEKAQEANQLLVQGFLDRLTELSHAESSATREFLEQRVKSSKKELDDAETKLKNYQVKHKIFSTDNQMKSLAERITELDKVKAQNKLDMETAQAALGSINSQLSGAGASIADSPSIQQAKSKLVDLEAQKASYVGKYTNENPKMKEINRQISSARSSLRREISAIVAQKAPSSSAVQQKLLTDKFTNEAMIAVAQGKNDAIDQLEKKNADEIAKLPQTQQGYLQVKRDADVAQEIYVMLAKRLEEAKVAEAMVPTEVQVVDEATLPEKPIKPRKLLTLVLALFLGLFGGAGYTIARTLLNRKIRTAADVEQYLELPVLGVIPEARSASDKKEEIHGLWAGLRRKLWKK
ncbi:GumC family protein [Acidaminococcus timonensis]|uniref:GumC family protein n=1 Tax=Acidaminococcus timonensis TaxID=1871002 RepID=UPI003A5BA4B9